MSTATESMFTICTEEPKKDSRVAYNSENDTPSFNVHATATSVVSERENQNAILVLSNVPNQLLEILNDTPV